jgi:ribonuclease P protein component
MVERCSARDGRRDASVSPCRPTPDVPRDTTEVRPTRFGLGAERRLARKADFERLLREGSRKSRAGYTLFYLQRAEGPARLGILISRKHAARATVRNGIKRCIREAFRLEHAALGAVDVLVRPPFGGRPGPAMRERLRELFTGLRQ